MVGEDEGEVFGAALRCAQRFLALPPERDDEQQSEDEEHTREQAAHRGAQSVWPQHGRIGLDLANSHAHLVAICPDRQRTLYEYV